VHNGPRSGDSERGPLCAPPGARAAACPARSEGWPLSPPPARPRRTEEGPDLSRPLAPL